MATRLTPEPLDPADRAHAGLPGGAVDGLGDYRLAPPRPAGDLFEGAAWTLVSSLCDVLALIGAAAAAKALAGTASMSATAVLLLAILAVGTLVRMGTRGMYGARPARMPADVKLAQVVVSVTGAAVVALAIGALLGATADDITTLTYGWACALGTVGGERMILWLARRRARRRGRSGKRAIIVGGGVIGIQLEQRLRQAPELGLIPIGFVDSDPPPAAGKHIPLLGPPDQLDRIVMATGAEHVIFAFTQQPDSVVLPLLRRCQRMGIEVSVVPRLFENVNERQWVEHIGGLPLMELRQTDPRGWQFAAKHAVDKLLSAALLIALGPVMIATAVGVRLSSPGPILFRQRRIGRDGREFDILKFRSMRVAGAGQDRVFRQRVASAGTAPGGIEGTDRRTRFGAFIRRSSLDELPQLINVVRGHMSLVGPRPERPEFVEMFGEALSRYDDRHLVRSGITGWAQVHGLRGQTSLAERVEWDNWYIQNWSLWLDLKILVMTPLAVLRAPQETSTTQQSGDDSASGPSDFPPRLGATEWTAT